MPDVVPNTAPLGWWRRILAMSNDRPMKMLLVALALCLVCSVFVSSAAVLLKPIQEKNELLARKREIVKVAGLYRPDADVDVLFRQIETRLVDLATGAYVTSSDPERAARDPALRVAVPAEQDIARIRHRSRHLPVYLVRREGQPQRVILPVRGYGLWSTMHGFVALSADGRTVRGLTFYEHAETPGLGGEIDNPRWQRKWEGKRIHDADGNVRIAVVKGSVNPSAPEASYQVDGLAGATLTGNGVTNLMRYWLGAAGFAPYLARLRAQGG